MAATVLNSPRAVELSLYIVRAFVRLREVVAQHKDLAAKLDELERRTEELSLKQDALAAHTRVELKQAFDAIRHLMSPSEPPKNRPIGFVTENRKRSS